MIHQEWDTKPHDMKQKLIGRISMDNIHELCFLTQGEENNHRKEDLYRLTFDEDNRVAFNALHVLSNFDLANNEWLYCKHDELIDRVIKEEHVGKRRIMLNLLLRQPFEEEFLRSDFIDFCVSKITACAQPYGYTSLLHEACLWANEVLSRTSQRVKDGIGHVGTRDAIPWISFRKKADIDENKKEAFFVLM